MISVKEHLENETCMVYVWLFRQQPGYSLSSIAHVQICLVKGGQAKPPTCPTMHLLHHDMLDLVYKQEYIHIQFHIHKLNNKYSITYTILYDVDNRLSFC